MFTNLTSLLESISPCLNALKLDFGSDVSTTPMPNIQAQMLRKALQHLAPSVETLVLQDDLPPQLAQCILEFKSMKRLVINSSVQTAGVFPWGCEVVKQDLSDQQLWFKLEVYQSSPTRGTTALQAAAPKLVIVPWVVYLTLRLIQSFFQ